MALSRNIPECPFCGKQIAKPVYEKPEPHEPLFFGDNFSHWEYKKHSCKGLREMKKEKNLVGSNKLISKFMGRVHSSKVELYEKPPPEGTWVLPEDLKYDTSWSWLMSVVEKIASLKYYVQITHHITTSCSIGIPGAGTTVISSYEGKNCVHKAVVKFIKWYNEQS